MAYCLPTTPKRIADLVELRQGFYFSPLVDFTKTGDVSLLTVPSGYVAIVTGLSAIVFHNTNVEMSALYHYGTTADPDLYMGWVGLYPHTDVFPEDLESINLDDEYGAVYSPRTPPYILSLRGTDYDQAIPAGTTLTAGIIFTSHCRQLQGKVFCASFVDSYQLIRPTLPRPTVATLKCCFISPVVVRGFAD